MYLGPVIILPDPGSRLDLTHQVAVAGTPTFRRRSRRPTARCSLLPCSSTSLSLSERYSLPADTGQSISFSRISFGSCFRPLLPRRLHPPGVDCLHTSKSLSTSDQRLAACCGAGMTPPGPVARATMPPSSPTIPRSSTLAHSLLSPAWASRPRTVGLPMMGCCAFLLLAAA
jgi:hypothetical protein